MGRDRTGSGVVPESEEEEDTEPPQTLGPQDNVSQAHSFAHTTRHARHGRGARKSISRLAPPASDGVGWGGVGVHLAMRYLQVIERQGADGPTSMRERNMLNIMAALHPSMMRVPSFVIDKSQTIGRTSNRSDGTIPTLTTTSDVFSFADGGSLSLCECLKLMGHDVTRMNVENIEGTQMRKDLGMSVHISIAGLTLAGLIASIGSG